MNTTRRNLFLLALVAVLVAIAAWFAMVRPAADDRGESSGRSSSARGARRDRQRDRDGSGTSGGGDARGATRSREGSEWSVRDSMRSLRVSIVPLGETPPTVARETITSALAATAPEVERCFAERGGRVGFGEALRNDAGMRVPRTVLFDLTPEGTVSPASIAIEPPIDPRYGECVTARLLELDVGPVGADGARVTVPMRAFRSLGGGGGDGGVRSR